MGKLQTPTQMYTRRPYGVGLLIAGYDKNGPHVYQTCPSANYFSCKAMSIGSRSQSARTYLEKVLDEINDCSRNDLVKHGLTALRETLPADQELTEYNDAEVKQFLDLLDSCKKPAIRRQEEAAAEEGGAAEQGGEEAAAEEAQPMEE